jgi:indole-3-glycerol phosphate synthase
LLLSCATFADELIGYCRSIGMEPLVEVHADAELDVALAAGKVIGVTR